MPVFELRECLKEAEGLRSMKRSKHNGERIELTVPAEVIEGQPT
jgi:hypothetical protein